MFLSWFCYVYSTLHVCDSALVLLVLYLLNEYYYFSVSFTQTHPYNGPFSGTTWVSRYQKGKTDLDFTEARDSEWQWHQLGHMQLCTSLQTDNHASTPPLGFFTGRMPFLSLNQQHQSTEGTFLFLHLAYYSRVNLVGLSV